MKRIFPEDEFHIKKYLSKRHRFIAYIVMKTDNDTELLVYIKWHNASRFHKNGAVNCCNRHFWSVIIVDVTVINFMWFIKKYNIRCLTN